LSPKNKPRKRKRTRSRKAKRDWKSLVGIAVGVLSIIIGIPSLIALMEAKPIALLESPLDLHDVLTTPFEIRNEGEVSLHDVRVAVMLTKIEYFSGDLESSDITEWTPVAGEIKPQETETIPSPFKHLTKHSSPILAGDVAIVILFRPSFSLFTYKRGFKFSILQQADGQRRFVPRPAEDVVDRYLRVLSGFPSN